MALAYSRVTAQGRTSVPAPVRRKLGVGPGSTLEWQEEGEQVVVRRAGRWSSAEVHAAIFPSPPRARTIGELTAGRRAHAKRRGGRR